MFVKLEHVVMGYTRWLRATGVTVLLMIASVACADDFRSFDDAVRGSGAIVSVSRDVSGFDEIEILSSGRLIVTVDGEESLSIEADDNLIEFLTSDVDGDRLSLGVRSATGISPSREVVYRVSVSLLRSVVVFGSADVTAVGIHGGEFSVAIFGSGRADLQGSTERLDVHIPGSGSVDADDLDAVDAVVTINGSGSVVVKVAQSLDAMVTGSGTIRYFGSPDLQSTITGSGSIRAARTI